MHPQLRANWDLLVRNLWRKQNRDSRSIGWSTHFDSTDDRFDLRTIGSLQTNHGTNLDSPIGRSGDARDNDTTATRNLEYFIDLRQKCPHLY